MALNIVMEQVAERPTRKGNTTILTAADGIYEQLRGTSGAFKIMTDDSRSTCETLARHLRAKGNVICNVAHTVKGTKDEAGNVITPDEFTLYGEWKENYVYVPQKRERKAKAEGEATEAAPKTGRTGPKSEK